MAGTLINEQGIIYESLYKCLKNNNMDVKKEDIVTWHGMKKEEVISNVVSKSYKGNKSLELTSEINNELISLATLFAESPFKSTIITFDP